MAWWNQKNLLAPPTNTFKSKTKDLDLTKLRNALQDCIKHFKNEDFMVRESALLSRILYRMKMKFRSSKEFKSLEKINHSLNIYLNTNIGRDLKNIFDVVPSKYHVDTYLPTRNMLSYILVRIQGLAKLMERIYDTCQVAAYEINDRLAIGHFWKIYVVLFAIVSRIYALVKYNTKLLCELYGKLLPHSNKLENTGRNWLPEGYNLPTDLREWLGVKWVYEEEFIDLTFEPSMKLRNFFDLDDEDDDDVQFCDEYVLIDEEDRSIVKDFEMLKPLEETITRNRMRGFSINEDDIGEEIAEIIKLNDTVVEDITSGAVKNNQEVEFYSRGTNKILEIEDIGEEISGSEDNGNNGLKIINLDETKRSLDVSVNKKQEYSQESKQLSKKNNSKKKKNRIKQNINDSVINLSDDSIIVIPETPITKTQNKQENSNTIILNDTNANTSVASNTINDSILNSSKNIKKKKNKSKKVKKALEIVSPINQNSIVNIISKKLSLSKANIYSCLNDSTIQTPSSSPKKKNKEKSLKNINDSEKKDESNADKNKSAKKRKRENEQQTTPTKEDITKSREQDKNNLSAVNKTPQNKKIKKRKRGKSSNKNDYVKSKDYNRFCRTVNSVEQFLKNPEQEITKKNKYKINRNLNEEKFKSPKYENIVRLRLVNEKPKKGDNNSNKDGTSPRKDTTAVENKKMHLVPRLETPLKGKLNIARTPVNEVSSSEVTLEKNFQNNPQEPPKIALMIDRKIINEGDPSSSKVSFEKNVWNNLLKMSENKEEKEIKNEIELEERLSPKNTFISSRVFYERNIWNNLLEITDNKEKEINNEVEPEERISSKNTFMINRRKVNEYMPTSSRVSSDEDIWNNSIKMPKNTEEKKINSDTESEETVSVENIEKQFTRRRKRKRHYEEPISKFFRNDEELVRNAQFKRKSDSQIKRAQIRRLKKKHAYNT